MSEIRHMVEMVVMIIFVTTVPTALVLSVFLKIWGRNISKNNM